MEISLDSSESNRNDHDYFGNIESIKRCEITDEVTQSEGVTNCEVLVKTLMEPEKKYYNDLNEFEIVDEEIIVRTQSDSNSNEKAIVKSPNTCHSGSNSSIAETPNTLRVVKRVSSPVKSTRSIETKEEVAVETLESLQSVMKVQSLVKSSRSSNTKEETAGKNLKESRTDIQEIIKSSHAADSAPSSSIDSSNKTPTSERGTVNDIPNTSSETSSKNDPYSKTTESGVTRKISGDGETKPVDESLLAEKKDVLKDNEACETVESVTTKNNSNEKSMSVIKKTLTSGITARKSVSCTSVVGSKAKDGDSSVNAKEHVSNKANNEIDKLSSKSINILPSDSVSNNEKNVVSPTEMAKSLYDVIESEMDVDLEHTESNDGEENDTFNKTCDSSAVSNVSGDESNDFNNDPGDEIDVSDVSSFAESEGVSEASNKNKSMQAAKKPRRRQPPIMIGYRKRRKVQHSKRSEDDSESSIKIRTGSENGIDVMFNSEDGSYCDDDPEEESHRVLEQSSSEENLCESTSRVTRPKRRCSSVGGELADKFCWICHKDSGVMFKCIACPRVFHKKCHLQMCNTDPSDDPKNFQCPECIAVLKADNVNTRSPTLATVNLDQLCVSLRHIINLMKCQKEAYYFMSPVDTKEFPHYREYVVHPMDICMLEQNVNNRVYGCTEAFLADVKWIVHNSIVFNSKAAKITNVAKNLLKICKREIMEIETCAECYYNSIVRIDTWFIEVCKKPHLLVWARLKGYPPWPAKALKCKDGMVDCRFFGAHDKAWVPLKDCFLYSKLTPQTGKVKKGSHLESGIEYELEKHIKKLRDKFGIFVYPPPRMPYRPSQELEQLRLMLPNYNPGSSLRLSTKYLIHPDRIQGNMKPKALFTNQDEKSTRKDSNTSGADSESTGTNEQDKVADGSSHDDSLHSESSSVGSNGNENVWLDAETRDEQPLDREKIRHSPSPTAESSSSKSSDVSDKRSSIKKEPKTNVLPRSSSIKTEKITEMKVVRKLVTVKNIEKINATVTSNPDGVKTDTEKFDTKTAEYESRTIPSESVLVALPSPPRKIQAGNPPKNYLDENCILANNKENLLFEKNETFSKKDALLESVKGSALEGIHLQKKTLNEKQKCIQSESNVSSSNKDSLCFDLDKVKDEPLEPTDSLLKDEIEKQTDSHLSTVPSSQTKRSCDDDINASDVKKQKTGDSTFRSVNITENVTLSVINQPTVTVGGMSKSRIITLKQLQPKKSMRQSIVEDSTENIVKPKSTPVKTVTSTVSNNVSSTSKPNIRILPRPLPHTASQMNAAISVPVTVPSKSNVTVVASAKSSPKQTESTQSTQNSVATAVLDECLMIEYHNHFRKFFEDTLEKLSGKGDSRAKVIMLQKEIDTLKRNHEYVIDELKRDYEMQIAELRATSIAKTQFDLAAERLKFEQEKERAVKEAKSKQWCSNCQRSANYYCCWNTAYCDFECQKDHWIHHMHVCKNDVKKKAAESSENEPPRIMMQNDMSSNYMLNGFDKSGSAYSYTNSNTSIVSKNISRAQAKNTSSTRTTTRPLLPRVSLTTVSSCAPPSSTSTSVLSSMTTAVNSIQHSFTSSGNCSPSVKGPIRPTIFTLRQSQQFDKQ